MLLPVVDLGKDTVIAGETQGSFDGKTAFLVRLGHFGVMVILATAGAMASVLDTPIQAGDTN
jgi:hypothetical protein